MDETDYGARLIRARESAGLTHAQLAELAGVQITQVYRYESGGRQPTLALAQRIAAALGRPDVALDAEPQVPRMTTDDYPPAPEVCHCDGPICVCGSPPQVVTLIRQADGTDRPADETLDTD